MKAEIEKKKNNYKLALKWSLKIAVTISLAFSWTEYTVHKTVLELEDNYTLQIVFDGEDPDTVWIDPDTLETGHRIKWLGGVPVGVEKIRKE